MEKTYFEIVCNKIEISKLTKKDLGRSILVNTKGSDQIGLLVGFDDDFLSIVFNSKSKGIKMKPKGLYFVNIGLLYFE